MKKNRLIYALIVIMIAVLACGGGSDSTLTPAPITAAVPSAGLMPIPLKVGYGVKDSWFELFFTDPTSPMSSQITGGVDGPLVDSLNSARLSIDVAAYSLSLNSVRNALINAHDRGVQVRMVMESDNMDAFDPQRIKDAAIPMIGDRRQGLMHDKFIVIDHTEVWTGSMNFTDSGAYQDNNNLMLIRSTKVAQDYTTEFEEMFLDDKFGPDVVPATPNPQVTLDGTLLEIYFSPDDDVASHILPLLSDAKESIYFMGFSFTSDELGEAIRASAKNGVTVAGVMDADQVKSNVGTEYAAFRQAGIDVRLDGNPGLMHHKVMIIDRQIVVMGSYNFTASAETKNDENVVIIHNVQIAEEYIKEFQRVQSQAQPLK